MTMPIPADAAPDAEGALYSVRLIDRRTGLQLRSGGRPMTLFTRTPRETAAEALEGRDPTLWAVRIERLTTRVPASA